MFVSRWSWALLTALLPLTAMAEPQLLTQMDGAAAECAVIGSGESTQAFLARRDFGERSQKYKTLVAKSFQDAKACVDAGKPKLKPIYKAEVVTYPSLKPAMTDAYAAWLGYMDWLSTPHDWSDESVEQKNYQSAANRLRAEIEAM